MPCYLIVFRLFDVWAGVDVDPYVTDPSSEPIAGFPPHNYAITDDGTFVDGQFYPIGGMCG